MYASASDEALADTMSMMLWRLLGTSRFLNLWSVWCSVLRDGGARSDTSIGWWAWRILGKSW
jgi:hypothetical protein